MRRKKAQPLTEEQAWLVLAVLLDFPAAGLCEALWELLEPSGLVPTRLAKRIQRRIKLQLNGAMWLAPPRYARPASDDGFLRSIERVDFANAQALRCRKARR